jgi:hypothetical protein
MKSSARARTQPLRLQRGLAVLRYTSGGGGDQQASIQLELNASVTALGEPGASALELVRVGQCVVLRISEPTAVVLRCIPPSGQSIGSVGVTLEYLTPLASTPKSSRVHENEARDPIVDGPTLDLSGHVSRLGDRRVSSGSWLSGPERPLPIEGIAIRFAEPQSGLRLRYFASDRAGTFEPSLLVAGRFAGTRGQARSLRELVVVLDGPDAQLHKIHADVMFLGSPVRTLTGTELRLRSQTGKEPLVGLRLSIVQTMQNPSGVGDRESDSSDRGVLVF